VRAEVGSVAASWARPEANDAFLLSNGPREDSLRTFAESMIGGACLLAISAQAEAESAREFSQGEWQRQQPRVSSIEPYGRGRGGFHEQDGWFGGQTSIGYSRVPEEQSSRYGTLAATGGRCPPFESPIRISSPTCRTS
jgi:hypothetical protein